MNDRITTIVKCVEELEHVWISYCPDRITKNLWQCSRCLIIMDDKKITIEAPSENQVLILVSNETNWSSVTVDRAHITNCHNCVLTHAVEIVDQDLIGEIPDGPQQL